MCLATSSTKVATPVMLSSLLRVKRSCLTLSQSLTMNPDKLFDYLDNRLPAAERAALERQLISDRQLQRELVVARQIHAGMRGDSREVLLPTPTEADAAGRGRKMALRVGAVFIVLMAVNVGVGLWLVARLE